MTAHETPAEYEASADAKQADHESRAFERSDAAKVAAVAAVIEAWHVLVPVAHIRTALADPDAALERVRAEARAEALRDAAETPAAMRVNTEGNANGREWLLFRADVVVQS